MDYEIYFAENYNRVDLVGKFAGYHRAEIYQVNDFKDPNPPAEGAVSAGGRGVALY